MMYADSELLSSNLERELAAKDNKGWSHMFKSGS